MFPPTGATNEYHASRFVDTTHGGCMPENVAPNKVPCVHAAPTKMVSACRQSSLEGVSALGTTPALTQNPPSMVAKLPAILR